MAVVVGVKDEMRLYTVMVRTIVVMMMLRRLVVVRGLGVMVASVLVAALWL